MTNERKAILDQLIAELEGTREALGCAAEEMGIDLTPEDEGYIFENIYQCEDCGIWTEVYYMHSGYWGQVCDDCYNECNEEDEND